MSLLSRARSKRQDGQAAVETALILPAMNFLVLGIIQLTLIQQASLMTEYAAYQACRAGIVWNANNGKMVAAARVALASTIGPSNLYQGVGPARAGALHEGATGLLDLAKNVASFAAVDAVVGAIPGAPKIIRVDTINPTQATFSSVVSQTKVPTNQSELYFDDLGYAGAGDGFVNHENYRQALLLTIRLRYMFEMKVPFADWIIQTCFFAANAPNIALSGALGRESASITAGGFSLDHENAASGGDEETSAGFSAAAAKALSNAKGLPTLTKGEFLALFAARQLKIYLVPLSATYTMRMQSNIYKSNLP